MMGSGSLLETMASGEGVAAAQRWINWREIDAIVPVPLDDVIALVVAREV
jgi:hypothetical protein